MSGATRWQAVGERLRAGRQAVGLPQWRLAVRLGVNQATVSQIERGAVRPRREQLAAYAALLQLDPEELLALAGYEPPAGRRAD